MHRLLRIVVRPSKVDKEVPEKLDIIEVPEKGLELRDLYMGWDFHVHDNASYGRKSSMHW
ncbi:MAG: hypothetical protein R2744_12225 [Bacteroidales bacterium]